jgi:cystathionine beta-lyase
MNALTAPSLEELAKRKSAKWRIYASDVLPLPVAEMDFEIALPIRNVLHAMLDASDTGYAGPCPELGQAFAGFAARRWNWAVNPELVKPATDVGVAGVELIRAITKVTPGSVAVSSPVYHNLFNWIAEANVPVVDVPLSHEGNEWLLDFDALEAAFASDVSVYILCSPHNPVGKVYTEEELKKIAELALKHKVMVLADEIHAPLTFAESKFVPYLAVSPAAAQTGICITAASKSWNLAGLKCAIMVTADQRCQEIIDGLPINVPWRASLFGQWASVMAWSESEQWLDAALETLDHRRHLVKELLATHLPLARYEIPTSTYLAWVDLSAYMTEKPAELLLDKARVAFNEGTDFGPAGEGHVRINFATSEEILREAIKRCAAVLVD